MPENLPDSDIHVGVYTMKSGSAADSGQPAGTPNRDLPGFSCLHRWLFNHLCLFLRTSPSRDEWKKENWDYAQLDKEIHIQERKNACILNFLRDFQECVEGSAEPARSGRVLFLFAVKFDLARKSHKRKRS